MKKATIISSLVILISTALAIGVSFAGGDGGARVGGFSVFVICGVAAFAINWIAFIPANINKTEHFYDLTGSVTYLTVIALAVALSSSSDAEGEISLRALLVACMVVIWASRLGIFLFTRIRRDGKDDRFDEIKISPIRFFLTWTLQGLWVVLTAACALVIITGGDQASMGVIGWLGAFIWLFGFIIEVVADKQKSSFKKDVANSGKFISSGLWSWSRHPNYFGEMLLWFGVAVMAIPVLQGWQWVCLISPIFVYALIAHVSGVNQLEAKADRKWGKDPAYLVYKHNTSELMLRRPLR
jgi:steroid 5-alpha reductase family enzyme